MSREVPMSDEQFAANMESLLRGYAKRAAADPCAARYAIRLKAVLDTALSIGVANAIDSGQYGLREYARLADVDKRQVTRWADAGRELISSGTVGFALARQARAERAALLEKIEADKAAGREAV